MNEEQEIDQQTQHMQDLSSRRFEQLENISEELSTS